MDGHGLKKSVLLLALLMAVGCLGGQKTMKETAAHSVGSAGATGEVLAEKSVGAENLGQVVSIEGVAENEKIGPVVGGTYVDLPHWSEDLRGQTVRATGTVIQKNDLPVFDYNSVKPGEPVPAGIPLPEGADLEAARIRYVLSAIKISLFNPANGKWELVELPGE